MIALPKEAQLRTYAAIRSLESRCAATDGIVGALKRSCLHGGEGAMAELVALAADLRWQMRNMVARAKEFDIALGLAPMEARSEGPGASGSQPEEQPCIRGSTDVIGVPDLFSVLSSLGKTGTLALTSGDAMFVFEVQGGQVVHAVTNRTDSELRLGTILVAQNLLTEEQLAASIENSLQAKELLGEHLVRSETVSEVDLRSALNVQVHRIFEKAFALSNARFSFAAGSLSKVTQRAAVNTTELLLEAARQMDHDSLEAGTTLDPETQDALDQIFGG